MSRIAGKAVLLGCLLLLNCKDMKSQELMVIGHRGAMGYETENTLASIQKALDLGVQMIEIDVFLIASGEIVVFHDKRVDRLSNGKGSIEEYNIGELDQLVLNGGHKIPLLQDVIGLIDKKTALNIELKGANTSERVNFIIENYIENQGWQLDQFIISSFNWGELRSMRAINPNIQIAVLTDKDPVKAIPVADELRAVAINPDYKKLNQEKVDKIHAAGFKVFTYTVNSPSDIDKMKNIGVDGIFSDYPDRIR